MQIEPWRRNLYLIAIAEFIALLAFSLFLPFLPLYIQHVGKFGSGEAALWSGISTGCAGFSMFISSPIWGMIADRWGRKPMVLRAQFGGALIAILFIFAANIPFIVFIRTIQGIFTGTVAAASALISANTPKDKLPFSMGVLMGSVLGGQTVGPLVGGMLSDHFGFQVTFIVTACLLAAGGLIVLFFVKEDFKKPATVQSFSANGLFRLTFSRELFPILLILAALSVGPQISSPVLTLIIKDVSAGEGAASAAGTAFALMGVVGVFSSQVFARLRNRWPLRNILVLCCFGTAVLFLPPIWADTTFRLIAFIAITGLFMGGIITSSNSLVSYSVPLAQQGVAYGLSQSANSLGSGIGPFIGGGLAPVIGLRPVFAVSAAVFIVVGFLALRLIPKNPLRDQEQVQLETTKAAQS